VDTEHGWPQVQPELAAFGVFGQLKCPGTHDVPHLSRAKFQIELAAFNSFPAAVDRIRRIAQVTDWEDFLPRGQ